MNDAETNDAAHGQPESTAAPLAAKKPAPGDDQAGSDDGPRRNFLLELGSLVVGGVVGVFGLLSGLLVFADPLLRRKQPPLAHRQGSGNGPEGYVKVANVNMLPEDGQPRRFPVIADQIDAWNFSPDQPVGAVYARRDPDTQEIQVLHATCPHAGCAVSYNRHPDPERRAFECPCHNSAFAISGGRVNLPGKENPSPRDMDSLVVDRAKLEQDGEIWIQFVNYYTGRHDRKAQI